MAVGAFDGVLQLEEGWKGGEAPVYLTKNGVHMFSQFHSGMCDTLI
jgi:hypothetical protein